MLVARSKNAPVKPFRIAICPNKPLQAISSRNFWLFNTLPAGGCNGARWAHLGSIFLDGRRPLDISLT